MPTLAHTAAAVAAISRILIVAIVTLAAGAAMPGIALGQQPPGPAPVETGCSTFADFLVAAETDGAVMLADLRGEDVDAFILGLSRFGNVGDIGPVDEVAAFWVPGAATVFVIALRLDCIVAGQQMPHPIVALVLREIGAGSDS